MYNQVYVILEKNIKTKFQLIKNIFLTLLLLPSILCAQKKNEAFQYHISTLKSPITIDGEIDPVWLNTDLASDFFMVLPNDTSKANVRTEVRMAYDTGSLYIIAICYKKANQPYMVESLKRDFSFGKNDNFFNKLIFKRTLFK